MTMLDIIQKYSITIMNDFFEDIKECPKEIYKKPIRKIKNFFNNLKRSSRWFLRMWNNYDWDGEFLIIMIVHKLKDIRYQLDIVDSWFVDLRHQPDYNSTGDNNLTVDRLESLDKAIEIGERIIADDYIKYTPRIEEWFDGIGDITVPMPEDLREELKLLYIESEEKLNKDKEDFFNIIRDNHIMWWS